MCRCKYPKYVDKHGINIIEDKKGDRCYKISFDFGKSGSNILIISRAPKRVEENSCDSLYKRVVKFVEGKKNEFKGIHKVTIVNLFTVYEYSREDLFDEVMIKGKEYVEGNEDNLFNDKIIAEEIHNADYIIAGWGEPLEGLDEIYVSRVELVLKSLRHEIMDSHERKHVLKVGKLSKRGYPKHCFVWAYHDELENLFE